MSRIVGLTVLALPCFQSSLAAQVNQPSWNRVSSFQYDWNRLAQPATFILEREPHADVSDFNRIRIQVPGHKDFVLTTESGWVKWNAQDYDPLNVYKLSPIQDGAQAEVSLALSKQYNLTHYYG